MEAAADGLLLVENGFSLEFNDRLHSARSSRSAALQNSL